MSILLENRSFLVLWFTQTISQISNAFHLIALPLWAYSITGSSFQTGIILVLELVPAIVIGLIAGVIVDRYSRKLILIFSDIIRALLVGSLLLVPDIGGMWIPYVVATLTGITICFSVPAQTAIVQLIVNKEQLPTANSLLTFSMSFSLIIGPTIGGIVIGLIGYQGTFIVNSISFLIAALGTTIIKVPDISKKYKTQFLGLNKKLRILEDLKEGVTVIKENQYLFQTLIFLTLVFFATGANGVLFVLHLENHGLSAQDIGMFMSFQGIGMIVGAVIFPKIAKKITNYLRFGLINIVIIGTSLIVFIQLSINYFYLGAASIIVFGLCHSFFNTSSRTLIQIYTPVEAMGRVSGVQRILTSTFSSLAIIFGSFFADIIGPAFMVTIYGFMLIIFCSSLYLIIKKFNSDNRKIENKKYIEIKIKR